APTATSSGRTEHARTHFPQLREETLRHGALQVSGTECSTRASGHGADDALHELNVLEAPHAELLVILEQRFRQEEQIRRPGPGVQGIQRSALLLDEPVKQTLQG